MRNFAFAALVAVATALVYEPMTAMNFPTASTEESADGVITGVITADAFVNEIVQTNDLGEKSAVMWVQFTTTCTDCHFKNDSLIQNWMQMEGDEPGKFDGFTCTAQYN